MEDSLFWTTSGTGDGASGGYTMAELVYNWLKKTLIGDPTDEGVLYGVDSDLAVSDGGGTQVNIAAGAAYVGGFFYYNTTTVNKTLDTPTAQNRIDRIVLRADWTAQTVRITVIKGTEGGGAPSLTQTEGTIWEISLAQVTVTTGGDLTNLTDERVYLHPNFEVDTAMIRDQAVTTAKLPDSAISTAKLANDSVDDTKAGNRVPQFYRRQGGSATDWSTVGTTTYTPDAVRMQGGAKRWSGAGASSGYFSITFPVAFSYRPIIIATVVGDGEADRNVTFDVSDIWATGAEVYWKTTDGTTKISIDFHWLAIGPE